MQQNSEIKSKKKGLFNNNIEQSLKVPRAGIEPACQ